MWDITNRNHLKCMTFFIQVTENVISYQMAKYAKKKGIGMEEVSDEQKLILIEEMIMANYPGNMR